MTAERAAKQSPFTASDERGREPEDDALQDRKDGHVGTDGCRDGYDQEAGLMRSFHGV